MAGAAPATGPASRQAIIGLSLAALIMAGWLATHIVGMFLFRLDRDPPLLVPVLIALQCWLDVGLFIVAHDAMHGSLAPFRPRLNRAIGRLCLALYAGFSYDRLIGKHFDHHRHAGTAQDPDFHAEAPHGFWRWYVSFITRYFGLREFGIVTGLLAIYLFVFRVRPENLILFWAVPALLSSAQLFYFGTYLPHRHEDDVFVDNHNARSSEFGWALSLLTCFHFGYHHEHHDQPRVPWWRLPQARRGARST